MLLQREREFTAVWRAECEINKILGAEYPFADPPDLPSCYKPVKKKRSVKPKPKIPRVNSLIRNLYPEENAYRIVYEAEGKEHSTYQIDTRLLRSLMTLSSESFSLKLIETVILKGSTDYESIEVLWEHDQPFRE